MAIFVFGMGVLAGFFIASFVFSALALSGRLSRESNEE
jgi:hypothetical protein